MSSVAYAPIPGAPGYASNDLTLTANSNFVAGTRVTLYGLN